MKIINLKNWDIENTRQLLFFAQRAEELLFDYSLDSYKTYALNAPSLCKEAIEVIENIEKNVIDEGNILPVLDELSWSVQHDNVAKALLDLDRSQYIVKVDKSNLSSVKAKIEVLERTISYDRYVDKCIDMLKSSIGSDSKKELDDLMRMYFTSLINIGVKKRSLYDCVVRYFYDNSVVSGFRSNDDLSGFLKYIEPVKKKYRICLFVSDLINSLSEILSSNKVEVTKHRSKTLKTILNKHSLIIPAKYSMVSMTDIDAFDAVSAREEAERKIVRIRDLYTLYHHKNQIAWCPDALIYEGNESELHSVVSLTDNPMEKGFDLKAPKASEKMKNTLSKLNLKLGKDLDLFLKAVDFHGLAVSSTDRTNQLLNIWIALETIVPRNSSASYIKQIIEGVIPFVTLNYAPRVIGRLGLDLQNWNRGLMKEVLTKIPFDNGRVITKVFHLISNKNFEELRNHIYGELDELPLLRYRMFRLCEVFSNAKNIIAFHELHEKKVEWQIRRIYRTRNLIIHSAQSPSYIATLIENGHDYLDQVLMTILHMSTGTYRIKTIEQAFELSKIAQTSIYSVLKRDQYDSEAFSELLTKFR